MRFVCDGLVILPIAYCDFTVVFRFVGRVSDDVGRVSDECRTMSDECRTMSDECRTMSDESSDTRPTNLKTIVKSQSVICSITKSSRMKRV